ncbi:polyprenyl synthetase family protein [Liquorilactobacillus mali]|uniref:Polyprenyl diphosphate synthase n=1 Tax=Liquorilactobacillus mali KCTC 3596 = DSM 20444 TaxID=1046596 RepID=J0KWY3_9LACO|nr:polyprenyl synthetase family protein [Liquorilactobacillus mali]EJE97898.1 putative polyprenyl diphosphate synthase [Liquorilactobacillus mali KCTC 3596 = DSM 20444]KRN09475.1 polyprenyl diphosphate synthase [Liquorilactobacillus mali KCTC 3596 = DSM 20444]MDV7758162.1 polyprenyl synthetase family protein [Liquorilactobacillus mali]QFQ75674.1 polyprenyl synthetase family protein [Liquorilactobacillus mali]
MLDIWSHYPNVAQKLNTVSSLINEHLSTDNPDVQQLLADLSQEQGKMLRPGLFFLFAELGDNHEQNEEQLLRVAASLEILHKATLVHDDIIDDSPLRHGVVTIQSNFGKDVAVYAGDLLFTAFFELLIDTMNGMSMMKDNATAMKKLLFGELSQMHARFNQKQTIENYVENVKGKTAELFRLACLEGAYFGKSSPEITQIAASIGENIGIAFQIYDDILDYTSSSKILKKPVLEDLAQGVYTSPLLFAIAKKPQAFAPFLDKKQNISVTEIKNVSNLVHKLGGVKDAIFFAQGYTRKALEDIDKLPQNKITASIKELTTSLLNRKF